MRAHQRFGKDQKGTTAVVFSLTLLPILAIAGAALDYSRASSARAGLQKATDAAALALVRDAGTLSDAQLRDMGQKVVDTMLADERNAVVEPIRVVKSGKTIRVIATGQVKTTMMGVLGFDQMKINAQAESSWSSKKIELALVLDNTGSMNDVVGGRRKLDELKRSSSDLLRTLNSAAPDSETIKVSIVPFDTMVRVDPAANRTAPWIKFANPAQQAAWKGYIQDRAAPYNTSDAAPVAALPDTLYPANSRNDTNVATIQPLTSVVTGYAALQNTVTSMRAVGCTNITVGATWGLSTLSNAAPMTGGAAAGTPDIEKIMILLTDGDNTQDAFTHSWGCGGSVSAAPIDTRTRAACGAVKTAGVRVYTVRLISGNAGLLRDCASTGKDGNALYFDVQNTAALNGVFQQIVSEILGTRLTH
jgi:hypothetical protein